MSGKQIFNLVVAMVGSMATYLLGGWDTCLIVLVWFMALDYVTGVIGGIVQKKLNSTVGFVGILRKATIIIVLIVAVLLDRLLNGGTWVFRTLVCYFYIANEAISLLENATKIGIPIPEKLVSVLDQLKKK